MTLRRNMLGILLFGTAVAVLVGILRLFNWVPTALQEGAFQKYDSIDEVRAHLKIRQIYTPAFYPESVRWPPAVIGAQTRPYPAVVTEFTGKERADTYLVITQTARPHPPLQEKIILTEVKEKVRYPFKGRDAVLEVGVCKNDEQCSRIAWNEGEYRITLVMKSSPVDLVEMAESMISGRK